MADFPTQDDLVRVARDTVLTKNAQLSLESVERDGTDANVLVASMAAAGDEVVGQLVNVEAGQFLDSAEDTDLDRLVFDRYGLVRKAASSSQGTVQFTTTAPNPGSFVIPKGTLLQTQDGVQFATLGDVTFPTGSTGPIDADVRSLLAGSNQIAKPGTLTIILGAIPGVAQDLAVTNALATFGADDEEQDPSLRDRARRFFTTARRGTLGAIVAGALAVPGVRTAEAFEALDYLGRPSRFVELIITDAFTDAFVIYSSVPPTYQAQSISFSQTVFAALDDVRAAGIYVLVRVAEVVIQPIQLQLVFAAGVDVETVALQARAVAYTYMADLPPGGRLVVATLASLIAAVPGIVPTGQEVLSPPGDVLPQPLQALRCPLALVTIPG